VADDLTQTLTQLRRDIVGDVQRMFDERFDGEFVPFRDEMRTFRGETLTHFDAIYKMLDTLNTEYAAIKPRSSTSRNA
jgi:hypothetical protein